MAAIAGSIRQFLPNENPATFVDRQQLPTSGQVALLHEVEFDCGIFFARQCNAANWARASKFRQVD